MRKTKTNKNIYLTIIPIIIIFLVIVLSIGWASLNSSFHVSSSALARIVSDSRITDFSYYSGTSGVVSSNEGHLTTFNPQASSYSDISYAFATITLPYASSTATYKVEVTNMELATNSYMGINSITGLPNNLKIVDINSYTLKNMICDDSNALDCGSGAQKTFYVTIGYNTDNNNSLYNSSNTTFNVTLQFDFKKVYNIIYSDFINPPVSPRTIINGDTATISLVGDSPNDVTVISGGNTLIKNTDYTYSNYILTLLTPASNHIYIYKPVTFMITYVKNDGSPNETQQFSSVIAEPLITPTRTGFNFVGWYEQSDPTTYITSTSQLSGNTTLYAEWSEVMQDFDYSSSTENSVTFVARDVTPSQPVLVTDFVDNYSYNGVNMTGRTITAVNVTYTYTSSNGKSQQFNTYVKVGDSNPQSVSTSLARNQSPKTVSVPVAIANNQTFTIYFDRVSLNAGLNLTQVAVNLTFAP